MGKKLDIIKEAIKRRHPPGAKVYDTWDAGAHKDAYHSHMSDMEDWTNEGMNSNDEDYDHRERCYDRAEEHKEKADFHARRHFELTGDKISQPDRKLRKKSNPNHVGESKDMAEGTFSNKDKAEWHDSEANMLQGKSAADVARWYGPNVSPAHAQEAHRRNIAIHKEKAERHRKLFVELGEAKKPKKIRVKVQPWHWSSAKKLWGERWGGMFHAKTPLSTIPKEAEHNGVAIKPYGRVVWQARAFAASDAKKDAKKKRDIT